MPLGGFYEVWRNQPVWSRLQCAVAPAEAITGTEAYLCYVGHSIWVGEKRLFVVIEGTPGTTRGASSHWTFVADRSGKPLDAPLMDEKVWIPGWPQGCFPATGRHGWLARELSPGESEGWSQTAEIPFEGAMQQFEGGWLLWNGDVCFVLFADGTWTMY